MRAARSSCPLSRTGWARSCSGTLLAVWPCTTACSPAYSGQLFALVALGGGIWHYRTAVAAGRERGLTVFVGIQVAWLVVVLLQNGAFSG